MKPDTEECILYESICMKFYQMPTNLQRQKAEDQCLPRAGGGCRTAVKGHKRLWGVAEELCVLTVWWAHRCRQVDKECHLL